MTDPAPRTEQKRRRVTWFHRRVANPLTRPLVGWLPGQALLETTGRHTGLARRTPVGGRIRDDAFWMVSDHGLRSQYVKNIAADPRVRVRVSGRWHTGTAHLLPEDDARARLRRLPWWNGLLVRALGTGLLTIRIDLDAGG